LDGIKVESEFIGHFGMIKLVNLHYTNVSIVNHSTKYGTVFAELAKARLATSDIYHDRLVCEIYLNVLLYGLCGRHRLRGAEGGRDARGV
jgi:hypothetical protein